MSFVHLHVHTQFSIADATTRVGDLVKQAAAWGMPAVAMTDHDNLHGGIEFTDACKKHGIKPIYGCCIGISARPMGEPAKRTHHLTLLAQNNEGYQNLIYLISQAHLRTPATQSPRIDHEELRTHAAGLIGLSGDLAGEIPNALLRGEMDEARALALHYKNLFEPGNFYLEAQAGGLDEHARLLPMLVELGRDVDLPVVASNDVHYLQPSDARAHEVLLCIGLGIQARPEDQPLPTTQLDFASPEEMRRRFAGFEHLCEETLRLAERCDVKLDLGKSLLPRFPVAEGKTEAEEFAELSRQGLERRFKEFESKGLQFDRDVYHARLEREIGVIQNMDFPGYFLIVQDFINWAKENDIPVGPGRGSGAGSLVAYALRITDLDPLPYNLLFERFLNPERVSMPDFDIDFCVARRGEVIRYVSERYGQERVGQIATFGTLKAKGAVRDVGRVLGVPLPEVDRIARLIDSAIEPLDPKHQTVADAIGADARLQQEMEADPQIAALLETAKLLEGAVRNVGMHAAGVVIGRGPLWTHVPTGKGQAGENVTQFDKDDVEKAGLVKFDFLGLKNLTMIRHCVDLINKQRGPDQPKFDIDAIPLDDPKAYEVVARGDTAGIFQCESSGFTAMMRALQPTELGDLIAAGALYRPGPLGMGMHTRYIERKHNREPVEFPHPKLSEVLAETYGVIVYQEQVMQVAQILAGFSLGQADNLRRAMGKKKADEMAKWGEIFKTGAIDAGVDPQVADDIFAMMAKFAEYGFNKSHSAAYGLVTYQTAYLKGNFPTEFYAALLTADQSDTDSVRAYMQQAREAGIAVLPPDANESSLSFSVSGGKIRFGLGAIKGLGEGAIEVLVEARKTGPFTSLFDLVRRIDTRRVNRKALEVLIKCGACDSFGQDRDVLFATIGRAIDRVQGDAKAAAAAQFSLFGASSGTQEPDTYVKPEQKWPQREILQYEHELLGYYLSGHPLERFQKELWKLKAKRLADLKDPAILRDLVPGRRRHEFAAVLVASHQERRTSKGTMMGITQIEDLSGQAEVLTFERALGTVGPMLGSGQPLLLKLSVDKDFKEPDKVSLKVEEAQLLEEAVRSVAQVLRMRVPAAWCQPSRLDELRTLLAASKGPARIQLLLHLPGKGEVVLDAGEQWKVAPNDALVEALEKKLGRGAVQIA